MALTLGNGQRFGAEGGESVTESPSAHANCLHGGSEQIGGASRSATALPTAADVMSSAADPTHVPQAVFRQDTGACSTNPTVPPDDPCGSAR